jgi:hypothetical protein
MKRFTSSPGPGGLHSPPGEGPVPITALVLLAAAATAPAPPGAPVRLQRVSLALPDRDVVRVTLHAAAASGPVRAGLAGQRLRLGDVAVPLETPADVTLADGETRADFDVKLRSVPEKVLALDQHRLPVLWEGLDARGALVLAVAGTVDLGDPGEVEVEATKVYDAYAHVSDLRITPSLAAVGVHALLSLYNPLGFDVVATGLEYRLAVGTQQVLAAKRPGFKLRAGQRSDVLIEQDVPLGDVAGGVAAFLRGEAAQFDGTLAVRTPDGERAIPLHLTATMK